MSKTSKSYRTDDQLQQVLHEPAIWVIHGRPGSALARAPSLHAALEKYGGLAQSGAVVSALTCLPLDNIVIFPAQADRVRKIVAGRELPLITETEWWDVAN